MGPDTYTAAVAKAKNNDSDDIGRRILRKAGAVYKCMMSQKIRISGNTEYLEIQMIAQGVDHHCKFGSELHK